MKLDWAQILQVLQTILAVLGGLVQPKTGGDTPVVDPLALKSAVGRHASGPRQQHVEEAVRNILEAARK